MISFKQLRASHAFSEYSDHELELLLSAGTVRTCAPGDDLCLQGAVGTECFIVLDGTVDVLKATPQGECCISSSQSGSIVGQMALVGRSRRTATLRARNASTVLVIERDVYQQMLDACSPIALRFQHDIAVAGIRQLRAAVDRLAAVLQTGAQPNIAGAVPSRRAPDVAHRSPSPPPPPPPPPPRARASDDDEVRKYIESTAEKLHVPVDALEHVGFSRSGPPNGKARPR